MKVNCLNKISKAGLELLDDQYTMTEDVNEADAILVRSAQMHEMQFSEKLQAIARAGAGVNNIPLDRCAEEGIVVFNTPGANANGVKELVMAGLILSSRDLVGGMNWVKENQDDANISKSMEKAKAQFAGHEIKGKKFGVIGLGAIGVQVSNAASGLDMEVYGYDPFLSVDNALRLTRAVNKAKSREEIYKECDYITLHVPALEDTKGMINKETISMMKDGVVIINLARDLLVNEDDLAEALESGKVAKYVTDFPTPKVVKMKNVIAFPHLGASTEEAEDNCARMAVEQVRDYLEKGVIRNSVNYPACDPGECETEGRLLILHKNIPSMLTQFTGAFSQENVNIEHMVNKSRKEYAVTVMDLSTSCTDAVADKIKAIDGVLRVRKIK